MEILSVGIGGFIGSCLRFFLTRFFQQVLPAFPYGTLASNVIAAILIGFIIGLERNTSPLPAHLKLFFITGFLGGLSTFSAFSLETVVLLEQSSYALAGLNILLNVVICLICVVVGMLAAKHLVLAS